MYFCTAGRPHFFTSGCNDPCPMFHWRMPQEMAMLSKSFEMPAQGLPAVSKPPVTSSAVFSQSGVRVAIVVLLVSFCWVWRKLQKRFEEGGAVCRGCIYCDLSRWTTRT